LLKTFWEEFMKTFQLNTFFSLVIIAVVAGCGGGRDWPPTSEATGTVSLDGQPVEGATVSFFPKDGQKPANGETDSSGQFVLTTFNVNDGAMVGTFNVSVARYPKNDVVGTPGGTPYNPDMESDPILSNKPGGSVDDNDLPKKFADPETSGLTATAADSGSNVFNFELSSK
jgi:hypothetical protein